MSNMFDGVAKGLPALIGVIAGIFLFARKSIQHPYLYPVLFLTAVLVLRLLGRRFIVHRPRIALALIEPWYLSAICVMTLCTQAILWVTTNATGWFDLQKAELDAVSGALVGALTTYLAALWIDDIKKSDGPFLSSTQFRNAVQEEFSVRNKLIGDTPQWNACHSDRLADGTSGWGLRARWQRAKILSDFVQKSRYSSSQV